MQAPNVCLVVAHGWNIIEYLLLLSAPLVGGWWWGEHAVGSWENRPLRLFSRVRHARCSLFGGCSCVVVCGWGVSVGCVLLWPVLHSCVCLLVGVGVGVSGCGSWFFHSGREHLDIAIVTLSLLGRGLWLWCSV